MTSTVVDPAPDAICLRCGTPIGQRRSVTLGGLRPEVRAALDAERGRVHEDAEGPLCLLCATELRTRVLVERLESERGALSVLEREVAAKAAAHASIVESLTESFEQESTPGQRIADAVARVGGSWPFVGVFLGCILVWIVWNVASPTALSPDPYPFILLNLILSCIAALQAPIIMMSQNRAAARDRREADMDFRVNLKAELEVAALHEKVDHLLHTRWDGLMDVQRAQLELLEELAAAREGTAEDRRPRAPG